MTMRNDATRLRIETTDKRRARSVVARQGQVLLDTDVDEQARLELDRLELETLDTLGSPGSLLVPAGSGAFQVTMDGTGNPVLGAGHGYLDGWLLDNPVPCRMFTPAPAAAPTTLQPHPRAAEPLTPTTVVALKALIRHVDPVEDPVLADRALGDAQASGRALADWQAFALALPGAPGTCSAVAADPTWEALVKPSTGRLTLIEQAAAPSTDPCSLTPGGGYSRLENLLYRLEVDGGDALATVPSADGARIDANNLRLKLSRRNASVLAKVTHIQGTAFTVSPPALDPRNWFAPGACAEIVSVHDDVDPREALAVRRLFKVALASDEVVTLDATTAELTAVGAADDGSWYLRLWDAFPNGDPYAIASFAAGATESAAIDLGDGLAVKVSLADPGEITTFRRGDYWTFAARADGSVDWPKPGGIAQPSVPHGPEVRYARLQLFGSAAPSPADDCRVPFGTLSDRMLLYRGGDGQSVFPDATVQMVPVPAKLRVAVMVGDTPVEGVVVRWSYLGQAGQSCTIAGQACDAATPVDLATNGDGLCEAAWEIDRAGLLDVHQVQAAILDGNATSRPPIVFSATFEVAQHVGYAPPAGACAPYSGLDDVAAVLDELVGFACNPPSGDGGAGCCHTVGVVGDEKGEYGRIEEAIKDLRSRGHRWVCLCLLPGTHEVSPPEFNEVIGPLQAIDDLADLVIGGRGATIVASDVLVFSRLDSVALRDLSIRTKSPQALVFQGPEDPRLHLDVELTEIAVDSDQAEPGRALVTFMDCRRVQVRRSELTAPARGPGIRDVLPDRFAAIVEMSTSMERPVIAERLSVLLDQPPAARAAMADRIGRAIEANAGAINADERALLDRTRETIQSGEKVTPQRLTSLIADWRRLVDVFGPRSRGWPVAVMVLPYSMGQVGSDADVAIEGCRIGGGVQLGDGERDADAEADAELLILDQKLAGLPDGAGRLRVEASALGWLGIGAEQAKLLAAQPPDPESAMKGLLFGDALVSGNTFTSAPHAVVASAVTVHGNVFEQGRWGDRSQRLRVGLAAAGVVSAVGNLGPSTDGKQPARLVIRGDAGAAAQAANSRLDVVVA